MKRKRQLKSSIVIITLLFILAIWSGFQMASLDPGGAEQALGQLSQSLNFAKNQNDFIIFFIIFFNNAIKAFLAIILGLLFGLYPLFFIFSNGFLVGVTIFVVYNKYGIARVLAGLLPHGIFEVPAMILASSYGIWLGYRVYRRLRHRKEALKPYLKLAMRKYFSELVPLIFIAALIEAFVTPVILSFTK